MLLEDKCKWGESFIFVYDVTDKYSFDELLRLKFIASYTHSRLRVNFSPCWVLIGNKADLAERERMVSIEEGQALARDLGCHIFREISVKESMAEAGNVFEDLWREFSRISPRSPSSSQRRKFSIRIQDKIPTLESHSCSMCNIEISKQANISVNGSMVSSITNTLKRQTSVPTMLGVTSRLAKDFYLSDSNNNEERIDSQRGCPCIPEHSEDNETNEADEKQQCSYIRRRTRRCAVTSHDPPENKANFPSFARRKAISKSFSADNVLTSACPNSPSSTGTPLTSSSRSSSNSSLNGSTSPGVQSTLSKINPFDRIRGYESKHHHHHHHSDVTNPPKSDELVTLYQDYCRRQRARRNDFSTHNRLVASQSLPTSACKVSEVGGS